MIGGDQQQKLRSQAAKSDLSYLQSQNKVKPDTNAPAQGRRLLVKKKASNVHSLLSSKGDEDSKSSKSSKGDGESSSSKSCASKTPNSSVISSSKNNHDNSFRVKNKNYGNKSEKEDEDGNDGCSQGGRSERSIDSQSILSNSKQRDATKKKKRRQPTTKLSFNSQVTVVSYNKYNQKLLSPPRSNESDSDNKNTDRNARQGLKVAKKSFKKRSFPTSQPQKDRIKEQTAEQVQKKIDQTETVQMQQPVKRPKPILKKSTDSLNQILKFNEDPQDAQNFATKNKKNSKKKMRKSVPSRKSESQVHLQYSSSFSQNLFDNKNQLPQQQSNNQEQQADQVNNKKGGPSSRSSLNRSKTNLECPSYQQEQLHHQVDIEKKHSDNLAEQQLAQIVCNCQHKNDGGNEVPENTTNAVDDSHKKVLLCQKCAVQQASTASINNLIMLSHAEKVKMLREIIIGKQVVGQPRKKLQKHTTQLHIIAAQHHQEAYEQQNTQGHRQDQKQQQPDDKQSQEEEQKQLLIMQATPAYAEKNHFGASNGAIQLRSNSKLHNHSRKKSNQFEARNHTTWMMIKSTSKMKGQSNAIIKQTLSPLTDFELLKQQLRKQTSYADDHENACNILGRNERIAKAVSQNNYQPALSSQLCDDTGLEEASQSLNYLSHLASRLHKPNQQSQQHNTTTQNDATGVNVDARNQKNQNEELNQQIEEGKKQNVQAVSSIEQQQNINNQKSSLQQQIMVENHHQKTSTTTTQQNKRQQQQALQVQNSRTKLRQAESEDLNNQSSKNAQEDMIDQMKKIANQAKAGVRRQTEQKKHNFGAPKASKLTSGNSAQKRKNTVVSRAIELEKKPEPEEPVQKPTSTNRRREEKKGNNDGADRRGRNDHDEYDSSESCEDDAYSLKSSYDAEVASKHMDGLNNGSGSFVKKIKMQQNNQKVNVKSKATASFGQLTPLANELSQSNSPNANCGQKQTSKNSFTNAEAAPQNMAAQAAQDQGFPRRSEFSKVVSSQEVNVLQEIKSYQEYQDQSIQPKKATVNSQGESNKQLLLDTHYKSDNHQQQAVSKKADPKVGVSRGFSFGVGQLHNFHVKQFSGDKLASSHGGSSRDRDQQAKQMDKSQRSIDPMLYGLDRSVCEEQSVSDASKDVTTILQSSAHEGSKFSSDDDDQNDDDEEDDDENDDAEEQESEPSSYYMTDDDGHSDMQSSCMVSHRVDTASNISHLSAMKGSAYSARMVLNKSCFTSDVSDTSFSVAMYMPKMGAGNNAKGTDTSSRDNQSNGDDRSYEYKSHEEDKSIQQISPALVKQSKKMKRKKQKQNKKVLDDKRKKSTFANQQMQQQLEEETQNSQNDNQQPTAPFVDNSSNLPIEIAKVQPSPVQQSLKKQQKQQPVLTIDANMDITERSAENVISPAITKDNTPAKQQYRRNESQGSSSYLKASMRLQRSINNRNVQKVGTGNFSPSGRSSLDPIMFSHKFVGTLNMKSSLLISPASRRRTQQTIHRFDSSKKFNQSSHLQLTEKKQNNYLFSSTMQNNQFAQTTVTQFNGGNRGRTNSLQQNQPPKNLTRNSNALRSSVVSNKMSRQSMNELSANVDRASIVNEVAQIVNNNQLAKINDNLSKLCSSLCGSVLDSSSSDEEHNADKNAKKQEDKEDATKEVEAVQNADEEAADININAVDIDVNEIDHVQVDETTPQKKPVVSQAVHVKKTSNNEMNNGNKQPKFQYSSSCTAPQVGNPPAMMLAQATAHHQNQPAVPSLNGDNRKRQHRNTKKKQQR